MSDKLENALNAEKVDWEQVVRIFRRLQGMKHVHMYMCRIVTEGPEDVVDALMDHTRTRGYHTSGHLVQLISLIWTRILTGKEIFDDLGAFEDGILVDHHEMLPEWQETFLAAYQNWDKVGDEIRVPNIEKVVEALSKTAVVVRALPRPMNAAIVPTRCKVSKHGNSKVRITQNPIMPIVHFLVFQNLPPIIIYIAALVYPEQLGQRDPWGNLPLHYANLSATEWTTWRPRFIPFSLHLSPFQSAAPLISLRGLTQQNSQTEENNVENDDYSSTSSTSSHETHKLEKSTTPASNAVDQDEHDGACASANSLIEHLVHETAVPLLVTLNPQSIHSKCHAGRIPLQTYLLSLLDYRRQESQKYHILPHHPGTTWHFIQEDMELYLQHFPASVRLKDPQLHCLPFLYPALALGSRKKAFNNAVPENRRASLLTQDASRTSSHNHENTDSGPGGQELDNDDDDLRELPKPNKAIQDPFLDALIVSLTYRLLRSYPQICELCSRSAPDSAMLSVYERELYKRWKAKQRKLEDLEAGNKLLESKLQELLEINHRIKSTKITLSVQETDVQFEK